MTVLSLRLSAIVVTALAAMPVAAGAGFSCAGLVPEGQRMICTSFEPNWGLEVICSGGSVTSNFLDAFSGNGLFQTPGSLTFSSADPWILQTSHPISGSIAETPSGCTEGGSGFLRNFTFTPTQVPGLSSPTPLCCRIE